MSQMMIKSPSSGYGDSFAFRLNTGVGTGNFALPLPEYTLDDSASPSYDFIVDWGDGGPTDNITAYNDAARIHAYPVAGEYIVTITGLCEGWSFDSEFVVSLANEAWFVEIINWGDIGVIEWTFSFYNMYLETISATDAPDLSSLYSTSLASMFEYTYLGTCDLSAWDVSLITSFNSMFGACYGTTYGIADWDVSAGTDFEFMFYDSPFNEDISGWDVGNGNGFRAMFSGATAFNQDIGGWDMSSCGDMVLMLEGTSSFDQDISGWQIQSADSMGAILKAPIGLSVANYDLLLNAWSLLTHDHSTYFPFQCDQNYTITTSQAARDILTGAPNNWTITDLGGI